MADANLFSTFLIVFREALEASLVVGIILTVLARLKQNRFISAAIVSSISAVIASIALGFALMTLTKHMRHEIREYMETGVAFLACGVLTYMLLWMEEQSRKVKSHIESTLEVAFERKELIIILALPFISVFREGAETVLFLIAIAQKSSSAVSVVGGIAGLLSGVAVVCAIFLGGKKIPIKPLFKVSGFILLFMAAGMLTNGIHGLQEFGLLPEIVKHVWNINPILNEKEGIGVFLKSIFGYNGNPSLLEVVAYVLYLSGVFLVMSKRKQNAAIPVSTHS